MARSSILSLLVGIAVTPCGVLAGFNANSNNNLAVYWGQNSYDQSSGPYVQQNLAYYCANTEIDIIPLAFMDAIVTPTVNFANAGNNCTVFSGTQLLDCPQIGEDIETCQTVYGKTITLSLGGATYSEGGFTSSSQAVTEANNVWAMFGPVQSGSSANRVFGNAVVDGFDFDFESTVTNMEPFASQLRSLMDAETAAGGKAYYLSAAPQCPYPDQADNQMLDGAVYFDFIMVQFYNNYCGVSSFTDGTSSQADFNIDTWDTWAHTVSLNPNVKVLVGIPGNTGAGGGYVSASSMGPIIEYCQAYSSFGGVMVWDMSQAYANPGFLSTVSSELGSGGSTPTTTTTSASFTTVTTTATITTTTGPASTSTAVGPYDQCGGNGYTGSTECESGYVCTEISQWWSQCDPA